MKYRNLIKKIFDAALDAALPQSMMREALSMNNGLFQINGNAYDLSHYKRIFIFGSGKASIEMAKYVSGLLGEKIEKGLVVSNEAASPIDHIEILKSTHPLPSQHSLNAGERLLNEFSNLSENDFFIYLLSGGSSALIEKPISSITLSEFQAVSNELLKSGMTIDEINVIRKHISLIKGGRLGDCTRAAGVVLVLSDVIGDDLSSIGSGPLYHDESTFEDAHKILKHYHLLERLTPSVLDVIEKGKRGEINETPKLPLTHIHHYIIGNNFKVLMAAQQTSENSGLPASILTSRLKGEAKEAALFMMSLAREISSTGNPWSTPVALIFGGETTVTVRGVGRGGRNQELALAVLREIKSDERFTFLSAGTDGVDGASDAAGAIVDHTSYLNAVKIGLDINAFLADNDSNSFFQLTGDLIRTGPTGTNVGDIAVLIVH